VTLAIDHLMWGAPDLALGMAAARDLFAVEPARGGSHAGLGTCNALLSLGDGVYLEIIAPDPDQDLRGTLGERLQMLDTCALVTWAVRSGDLGAIAALAALQQLRVRGPTRTRRQAPSGELLEWELLFLGSHEFSNLVPFFIDWRDTPHPATSNPVGGQFVELVLHSPRSEALAGLLNGLGVAVRVEHAAEPRLEAHIRVGREVITLGSSVQTQGLSFQPAGR